MRRLFAVLALIFACCGSANAGFWASFQAASTPTVTPAASWQQILVGGGGFFTSAAVASDNTQITGLDGPGAYIWNATATAQNGATGVWQPVITSSSMPPAFVSNPQGFQAGMFAITMQYTNSSNVWMVYPKWTANAGSGDTCVVYASTNKGQTWTATAGFAESCDTYTPWNGSYRWYAHRMDVDPTSNNNVFLGTQGLGLFFTQDAGATWTPISTSVVPAGSNEGVVGVLFNPQNHNIAFACVGGSGVYKSTNATSSNPPTFSLTSSGPTGCLYTNIDQANGNYYAIDEAGENLWVYNGSTWNKILTTTFAGSPTITAVDVDPTTANHVIVTDIFGNLDETFNANAGTPTWGGFTNGQSQPAFTFTNDAAWLSNLADNYQFRGIYFDRSNPLILHYTSNNGFFTTTLSGAITGSTSITLVSQSRGIENLTANHVLSVPTSPATIVVSGWDHPIFTHTTSNLNVYPTVFGPMPSIDDSTLCVAWDVDYASSNTAVIGTECDGIHGYGEPTWIYSGYSTNDGTSWTNWNTANYPTSASNGGQNIAFSTPSNCLWAPSGSVLPSYSNNCNTSTPTWTQISLPGSPSLSGFLNLVFNPAKEIAADRVNSGYFYLLDPGVGFFYTQNGGATWTAGITNTDLALTKTPIMKPNPLFAQDVFVAGGLNGPPGLQPGGGFLYHTIDGFATSCQITSMANPTSVGFGKPANGKTFPSIIASGWVVDSTSTSITIPGSLPASVSFTASVGSTYYPVGMNLSMMSGSQGSTTQFNGPVTAYNSGTGLVTMEVYNTQGSGAHSDFGIYINGVWENDNFSHTTCNPGSVAATWQLVGGTQYPIGSMQPINDVDGDMNIYGQAYIGLGVQGWAYYAP